MRRAAVSALQSERAARDGIPTLDLFAEEKLRARMAGAGARAHDDGGARAHDRARRAPPPLLPGTSIHDSYRMGNLIGKGGFGSVYRAVHIASGRLVAIKVPHQSNNAAEFAAEVGMLQHCAHANIVCFLEVIWSEGGGSVYLVQELVNGGSLSDYLAARGKPLCEREAGARAKDLLTGLQYLHSLAIIHRDIKPANLLLQIEGERTVLKISDFGLSTPHSDTAARRTLCGTPEYLAPEVIRTAAPRDGKAAVAGYSLPSDMWSAGCVVYTMLCMRPPFRADSMQTLFGVILAGRVEFGGEHGGGVSGMARDLITHLLVVAPEGRYSATDALTHPWMDPDDDDEQQPACTSPPPPPVAGHARAPPPPPPPEPDAPHLPALPTLAAAAAAGEAASPKAIAPHVGKPPRPAPASPLAEHVAPSRRASSEQLRAAEHARAAAADAQPQPAEARSPRAPMSAAHALRTRSTGASPLRSHPHGPRAPAPPPRAVGVRATRVSADGRAPTGRLLSFAHKGSAEPPARARAERLSSQAHGAAAPRLGSRPASPGGPRPDGDGAAAGEGGAAVWERLAHETTQSLRMARFARHSRVSSGGIGAPAPGDRAGDRAGSRRNSATDGDSAHGDGSRPDSPLASRPRARARAEGGAEGGGEQQPAAGSSRPSSGGVGRAAPTSLGRPPSAATRRPPLIPPTGAAASEPPGLPVSSRRELAVLQKPTASSESRQRQRVPSFTGQGRAAILALRLQHLREDADAAERPAPASARLASADWSLRLGAGQHVARTGPLAPASVSRRLADEGGAATLDWMDLEGRPRPKGAMAFALRAATVDSAQLGVQPPVLPPKEASSPRAHGQGQR